MPLASPGVSGPYHYSDRADQEESSDQGKVWPVSSLCLFEKIGVPVWLSVANAVEDRYSPGGFRNTCKPVYQNAASIRSLGKFRTREEISRRLNNLSVPEKENRRELCRQLLTGDVHRSWVHAESLLSPVFDGLPANQKHLTLLQQVVQVETSPGCVERCQLNQVEQVASVESARLAAMHHCSPIHTFMFSKDGDLLMANKRGLDRYRDIRSGGQVMLLDLFQQGVFTGMDTTAEEAYEEAMTRIFDNRAEVHRFSMPNMSRKQPNKSRWTLFEMWPINDPVDGSPAVLVKLYNVTQQKRMEAELQTQKQALARQLAQLEAQKAQLEQYNATIQTEKDNLQLENTSLVERLEAVVKEKLPSHQFDQETPVDKTLNLLQMLIMGEIPSDEETVTLFHLLSQANVDLRQPVSLEQQLMEDSDMEAEVGLAMVQLLKGNTAGRSSSLNTALAASSSARTSLDTPPSPVLEMSRGRARRSSMVSTSSITSETSLDQELDFGLTTSITMQVERMLHDAERSWQFDMFAFAQETNNNHLSVLTFHMMKTSGLVSRFNLSEVKLSRFLCRVERGYLNNPYHSSLHVASVVQMIHMIMHHGGLVRKKVVDDLMMMAAYMGAAIHDFEHGGVNNDFLIQTRDKLAVTYNDISPLENHHLAAAARLMCEPRYKFQEQCSRAEQRTLRSAVIEQVLGTDMKKHFNILSRFQNTFQRRDTVDASRSSSMELPEGVPFTAPPRQSTEMNRHRGSIDIRRHNIDSRPSMDLGARPVGDPHKPSLPVRGSLGSSSQNDYWENVSEENKAIIRQVMLKCADIGHLAAAPEVHRRWALLLEEEFFLQGDKESALGMPVSPLMDRKNKGGITRSQMSFFSIVGIPLFKSITDIFEDTRPMLQGVMENYKMWEKEAAIAAATTPRPHS